MEAMLSTRLNLRKNNLEALIQDTEKLIKDEVPIGIQELTRVKTAFKTNIQALSEEVFKYAEKCPLQNSLDMADLMKIQLKAEDLLSSLETTHIMAYSHQKTPTKLNETSRLPKLDVVKYDGNILKWKSFWDRFNASVHSKDIPDVEKLSYLQCALEGPARQAVEGLETTNSNYLIARDILENQFGKKNLVVDAHNEALQNLPKARETGSDCRHTLNNIEKHLRLLEAMGEQTDASFLRVTVMSKFPEKVVFQVDLMTAMDQSLVAIRRALNEVISAMEKSETVLDVKLEAPSNVTPASTSTLLLKSGKRKWDQANKQTRRENRGPRHSRHHQKKPKLACVFCGLEHYSEDCTKYKTYMERRGRLEDKCFICFRQGHKAARCKNKKKCPHCKKTHNRALCPQKTMKDSHDSDKNGREQDSGVQTSS